MLFLHISIKSILLQHLRKYHLLLVVHFGTSACVPRLLQLFSVSFGYSTSQLKVHFLALKLQLLCAPRTFGRAVVSNFCVYQNWCSVFVSKCLSEIRWNVWKRDLISKLPHLFGLFAVSSQKAVSISLQFPFYSALESSSWILFMEIFGSRLIEQMILLLAVLVLENW